MSDSFELTACAHWVSVKLAHVPMLIGITIATTNNHNIFALIWCYFLKQTKIDLFRREIEKNEDTTTTGRHKFRWWWSFFIGFTRLLEMNWWNDVEATKYISIRIRIGEMCRNFKRHINTNTPEKWLSLIWSESIWLEAQSWIICDRVKYVANRQWISMQ